VPETLVKLQYDEKYIYGLFRVRDRFIRAVTLQDQEQVCLDSCVEFFIRPVINLKATNSYDSSVEVDMNEEAD
jgi:hypothetical protein